MSSICGYICILLCFLTICDTRSINDDAKNSIEFIVDELPDNNHHEEIDVVIANYRHRFQHSTNFKKLVWALQNRYNKAYCTFCNLVVPVVRNYLVLLEEKN